MPSPDRTGHDLAPDSSGLETRALGLDLGGATRLRDITVSLAPTGITVLMGPNGAGKSLLLRVLHGLIPPSRGRVSWRGAAPGPALTRRQALVFQRPVLLRRTAAANLDFVLSARGRPDAGVRDAALDRVGLLHHARTPARRLSGGEQQRLALARALLTRPEVLFLDEPTAHLDPGATAMIESIVRDAATQGIKVLFVTHDPGQARRLATDVVFLHLGAVAEHAPATRFLDAPVHSAAADFLAGRLPL